MNEVLGKLSGFSGRMYSKINLQELSKSMVGSKVTNGINGPEIGKIISAEVIDDYVKFQGKIHDS